mmetsp:Transcript_692/g.1888  ORF Transcript_692/g.1888 Transcript_692/m.1888 type:complete len:379 (-) Transcript_692:581-1717(-)
MGSSFSSANNIYVHTDKPSYHAGDTISGHILLNCTEAFQCDELSIKIEGEEKVEWEERHETRDYDNDKDEWTERSEIRPYTNTKEFFKVKSKVKEFSNYCQPGQYEFPFTVALPKHLPGTFKLEETNNIYAGVTFVYTKAKVQYEIKAECEVQGRSNLKAKADIIVNQILSKPPSEFKASHTDSINTCCCCGDAGEATITARVQKDSYAAGETAVVVLEVKNDSDVQFKDIELVLQRTVVLTAGGSVQKLENDVAKHKSEHVVPPHKSESKELHLALPAGLLATTVGHVITCEYELVAHVKSEGSFSTNVKLAVPVLIYVPAPPTPGFSASEPPEWWKATLVAPPIELVLPSAPPMPPQAQAMHGGYSAPSPVFSGPQ